MLLRILAEDPEQSRKMTPCQVGGMPFNPKTEDAPSTSRRTCWVFDAVQSAPQLTEK